MGPKEANVIRFLHRGFLLSEHFYGKHWEEQSPVFDETAAHLGQKLWNWSAQRRAWHPYLRRRGSKKGREREMGGQSANTSTPIPVSAHTPLTSVGRSGGWDYFMRTHIGLVIKTSLAYITKDVCTVAACSNIYIQIFLLKKGTWSYHGNLRLSNRYLIYLWHILFSAFADTTAF